jgi:hypothetical protein
MTDRCLVLLSLAASAQVGVPAWLFKGCTARAFELTAGVPCRDPSTSGSVAANGRPGKMLYGMRNRKYTDSQMQGLGRLTA